MSQMSLNIAYICQNTFYCFVPNVVESTDLDCNAARPGGRKLALCWRSVLEAVGKKTELMEKFTAELQELAI